MEPIPLRSNFALSFAQKADAREAIILIQGTGLTLKSACEIAIQGRHAAERVTVRDAAAAFLLSKGDGSLRPKTVSSYEDRLNGLTADFGEREMDSITIPEMHKWIAKSGRSAGTRASNVRTYRGLWRWAMKHQPAWASQDPTLGLDSSAPRRKREVQYLHIDQVQQILAGAEHFRSAFALLLFAGVRPEELAGIGKEPLRWKHVNVAEKTIRIPEHIAKTGNTRVIEGTGNGKIEQEAGEGEGAKGLPDTVWAWLEPKKPEVRICPTGYLSAYVVARRLAGCTPEAPWPHDAFRHTFGTYAMQQFTNAGKVAFWMGHEGNPSMLYRHYRGVVSRPDSDRYWALRPSSGQVPALASFQGAA